MDKIQKLFEGLDAKVLTPELKQSLTDLVNDAVSDKADKLAQDKFKSLEEEYSKSLDEMIATASKTILMEQETALNERVEKKAMELAETYIVALKADAEKQLSEHIESFKAEFEKKLDYAVERFISENEAAWVAESEVTKANRIQEAFAKLVNNFNIEVISTEDVIGESASELSKAIELNVKLSEQVKQFQKEKILGEALVGLTAPQVDSFSKLVEELEFVDEVSFGKKVEMIKMAVSASGTAKPAANVVENTNTEIKLPSWKRK